jgi:hypothetical protein
MTAKASAKSSSMPAAASLKPRPRGTVVLRPDEVPVEGRAAGADGFTPPRPCVGDCAKTKDGIERETKSSATSARENLFFTESKPLGNNSVRDFRRAILSRAQATGAADEIGRRQVL